MVDIKPSDVTDREVLLEMYRQLAAYLNKREEMIRELEKKEEDETGKETSLILEKKADEISGELASELGSPESEPIIRKYLRDEAGRLTYFYDKQYIRPGMRKAIGTLGMWQRNVAMGTMTLGDVWYNLLSNIWSFVFGPWVLGSFFLFVQYLFIGAYITPISGAGLMLLWLAPIAGGMTVFMLNFQSSKSPMDWLTHFVSGAMIAYTFAILLVGIFGSISNFPGGTMWFWIVLGLVSLFLGTFQLYQFGGFRSVLQVAVIILLFGWIALGPYQAVYRSAIDKVKEPLSFAITSVRNSVKDVWLLATNPSEWYLRQQVKNVRSESPLEFPKGIEIVSLTPLLPGFGIPAGEQFSVVATIQNKGKLIARDVTFRSECNQWCSDKDSSISGLKLKPEQYGDATITTIKELKPGEQDRIIVSGLKGLKSDRSGLQLAKVTVFVNYSYSANSTLPVKVATGDEIDRMIMAREDVFRPVSSTALDGPAQLSLNVGPQPLKGGSPASLLIAVIDARTDGDVVLKANEKFFVDISPGVGTVTESNVCRGSGNINCITGEQISAFCDSINKDANAVGDKKQNCLNNGCEFVNNACVKNQDTDIMCEVLPKETKRTLFGKILYPFSGPFWPTKSLVGLVPGRFATSDLPELTIKGSEYSSILPVFCDFTTSDVDVFKSGMIRAELPHYTFVTKKSAEIQITQPLGVSGTSPLVSSVDVKDGGGNKAVVTWTTNRRTTGMVEYGFTEEYGKSASTKYVDLGFIEKYSRILTGVKREVDVTGMSHYAEMDVEPDREYHYRIVVTDDFERSATSGDRTFTTDSAGKVTDTPATPPAAASASTTTLQSSK